MASAKSEMELLVYGFELDVFKRQCKALLSESMIEPFSDTLSSRCKIRSSQLQENDPVVFQ